MLLHERRLTIYRTFENLSLTANVSLHCWLLSLEEEYIANNKKLPDTLYHQVILYLSRLLILRFTFLSYGNQIDGGSENTAKYVLGICELLVAKRLTRRIVLSRLPVGHTHEDIDAIFALIWDHMKNNKALSPKVYADMVAFAVRNKAPVVDVKDIWAVPDYGLFLKGFINPKLGRYAKLQWTQLQIIFEAVDLDNNTAEMRKKYPTGVKVSHRAYSQDEVIVFRK